MQIRENIPLAPYTTLRVGGCARYFVESANEDELVAALRWARDRRVPIFVLGGGSNLVVSDEGWPGLVLKIGIFGIEERGIEKPEEQGRVRFVVGAGEEWDRDPRHLQRVAGSAHVGRTDTQTSESADRAAPRVLRLRSQQALQSRTPGDRSQVEFDPDCFSVAM
jgi:hypothetical protein